MGSESGQGDLIPGNKELKLNCSKTDRNGRHFKGFALGNTANNTKTE
jgi:hypothetical protein